MTIVRMDRNGQLAAVARDIIDANLYLTLGTADADGTPWVSPVCFVADAYRTFYWASRTDTTHSRNLVARPEVSIVVFDSRVPVYQGRAVWASGVAVEVPAAELDAAIAIYNGPAAARGASLLEPADVVGTAPYRLYRASATRLWTLDPAGHDDRVPVAL